VKRLGWIGPDSTLAVRVQCRLAGVSRATVYARRTPRIACEVELLLCRLIDEQYTRRPFYGSRKMVTYLRTAGHVVNRKRVQRMMQAMGLAGMAAGPNTSKAHPQHKIYPYLLRGVPIVRPNQVWSTDITCAFDNIFMERLWRSVKHEDVYLNGYGETECAA